MQNILLKTLELTNFKGIRQMNIALNDRVTEIHGDNATGKTTIVDAFTWLLFGKNSKGDAVFGIKTLVDGEEQHGLEHAVKAVFDIDGSVVSMKRIYTENHVKKRGTNVTELKGHETTYYLNDVPVLKGEYEERIKTIFDPKAFNLVSSITAFASLPWQDKRIILLDVLGDILYADVIASDSELAPLAKLDRSIEDEKKARMDIRKKTKEELDQIPARIDALTKSVIEYAEYDKSELEKEAVELKSRIDNIKASGGVSELLRQKMELSTELKEETEKNDAVAESLKSALVTAYENANSVLKGMSQQKIDFNNTRNLLIQSITLKKQKEDQLTEEYKLVSAPITVETSCPTCGQTLEPEKINATKAEAKRQQTEKLEKVISAGKEVRKLRTEIEAELASLDEKIGLLGQAYDQKQKEVDEAKARVDNFISPELPERIVELNKLIADIQTQIDSEKADNDTTALETELETVHAKIANSNHYRKVMAQINELKASEKDLNAIYEECESVLFLIEKFIVAKVRLLEDRINEKFRYVRFKLFVEQINGGIAECCEILYDGVPFKDLNTGSRMNAGLDIINTLSAHYGLKTPVFVDNAESLTRYIDVDTQLIKLVVDANAKKLEVVNHGGISSCRKDTANSRS